MTADLPSEGFRPSVRVNSPDENASIQEEGPFSAKDLYAIWKLSVCTPLNERNISTRGMPKLMSALQSFSYKSGNFT